MSGVIFVLFLISIGVVVLSNLREMRLQNLAVEAQPFADTAKAVGQGFSFSPALLAAVVLSEKTQGRRGPRLARLLTALFVTYFVFTMVSELVLGGFCHRPAPAGVHPGPHRAACRCSVGWTACTPRSG